MTRSFWNIPLPSAAAGNWAANAPAPHVSSSTFRVTNVYSESCTASPTTLFWTPPVGPGTTWNNQPGPYGQLQTLTFATGRSGCPSATFGFDAKAGTTQQIAAGANHITLMLEGAENNITSWKKFAPDGVLTTTVIVPPTTPSIIDSSCHRSPGLLTNDVLHAGQSRTSANGQFMLIMQSDGNLVEYKSGAGAVWSTATQGTSTNGTPNIAILQSDGNLVVYKGSGGAAWSSGTYGVAGAGPNAYENLVLQDEGNLVLYENDGKPAWANYAVSVAASPAWTCWSNGTYNADPSHQYITVNATNINIVNGMPLNQYFNVWQSTTGPNPTTQSTTTSNSQTASGQAFTWPAPVQQGNNIHLTYQYQAQACVVAPDNVAVCSNTSQLINGILDTSPVAAPSISTSTVSGPAVSTDKNSSAGTVGVSVIDVHVTPATASSSSTSSTSADPVVGYEWVMQDDTTAPAAFQGDGNASCGVTRAGFTLLCTGSPTDTPDIRTTPVQESSQFSAIAINMAGTRSTAVSQAFYVNPDTNAAGNAHIWNTDSGGVTGCAGTSIADNLPSGPAAILAGSACVQVANPAAPVNTHVLAVPGTNGSRATASSGTTTPLVDTTQNFTVGAWLLTNTTPNPSVGMTAVSQQSANESAFDLQDGGGHWALCMPATDSTSWDGTCVNDGSNNYLSTGTWTFVVGEWDAVNHQLRLFNGTGAAAGGTWNSINFTPSSGANADQAVASNGAVWIGSGTGGATEQPFNGQIADAFITQGLLTTYQLQLFRSPSTAGALAVKGH